MSAEPVSTERGRAAAWSVDELMAVAIARAFDDRDQVVNGAASFIPVVAIKLARLTHAPRLVWLAGAVGLDAQTSRIPASTVEASLWHRASMYMPQYEDFWSYVMNGRWLRKFCVRGSQIDRFGNANNSLIGEDWRRPTVRLPGGGGMGDMGSIGKRIIYWTTRHDRRTFVERVDFVSCAGWLDGGDRRERLGMQGGPELVVTNLCVMDFEPETRGMRLRSVHPGVSVDQVVDATGFELCIPDEVPETLPPSPEEVTLIREVIDPSGARKRELA